MQTVDDLSVIHAEVMDSGEGAEYEADPERFKADTVARVRWVLRLIAADKRALTEIGEAKQAVMERYDGKLSATEKHIGRMRALIIEGLTIMDLDGVADPVDGSAQFVTVKPKPVWPDADTPEAAVLLDWAREQSVDFVRVSTALVKSEVKTYIKDTGELPPGVTMTEEARELRVSV